MGSKLFAATGSWTSGFLGRCHGVMRMLSVPDQAIAVQGQRRMLLVLAWLRAAPTLQPLHP